MWYSCDSGRLLMHQLTYVSCPFLLHVIRVQKALKGTDLNVFRYPQFQSRSPPQNLIECMNGLQFRSQISGMAMMKGCLQ